LIRYSTIRRYSNSEERRSINTSCLEKSFAGMKKGFLNSSSISKPKSNELIEISRKKPEQTKDFRVFDEVQQVMKEEEQSKSLIFVIVLYFINNKKINFR
jgi:hypothetical protein